jgi:hypothetical protein
MGVLTPNCEVSSVAEVIAPITTINVTYPDQILTSSSVEITVRNLSIFCKDRTCASLSDDDAASETMTG